MAEYYAFEELYPTRQHILNCSYASWYPSYRKITPKSHIIPSLPQSFIDYILSDGIKMPVDFYQDYVLEDASDYSDWDDEPNGSELVTSEVKRRQEHERRVAADPTKEFKEVHEQICKLFKENGPMLPKLNWSSPKDAAWILSNHTMKCFNPSDVYLILNASSYIIHDLSESLCDCSNINIENLEEEQRKIKYDLILKEWFEINPAWEFRCFVRSRKLIAVSHRDANYYDYLPALEETIKDKIFDFFDIHLRDTFPDANFVFDVYLPNKSEKVWLIDINPFARKTDSLLYSWSELLSIDTELPDDTFDLRMVNEFSTGRFAAKEHSENYVPKDMVDAAADTQKMIELMKAYNQQHLSDTEDDSDD